MATTRMLAAHHDPVRDLNARARQRMIEAGKVAGAQVRLGEQHFAVGDRVLGLANDYRTGMLPGRSVALRGRRVQGPRSRRSIRVSWTA
ncbi:MAG: hypothetical protein ACR2MB_14715 [Acidimicrobiales bacterium]